MGKDCVFCQIIRGETPTEILYATEQLVVFRDLHPQAPVHLLIVPKKHIRSVNDLDAADAPVLAAAGLPAEAIGILLAIDPLPNAFRTVANVTGMMAVTVLASGERDTGETPLTA